MSQLRFTHTHTYIRRYFNKHHKQHPLFPIAFLSRSREKEPEIDVY